MTRWTGECQTDVTILSGRTGFVSVMGKGNVQGTKTRWNQRKLTTRYATTSRKVSRTFEIQQDGRLLVTVKLDPNRAKAAVHKRVFDRVQ